MRQAQVFGVLALLLPIACSTPADTVNRTEQAVTIVETYKIGVLVDEASPAATNFSGAATLAQTQLNQALASAGVNGRYQVIVASYAAGQAQSVAVDLVNNQGVIAIVADTDQSTADVNRLNYDFASPIAPNHVTVTCYQCSSAEFNDVGSTDQGKADPDNWLFRTYYNASFEAPVQAQLVLGRTNHGDLDGDGFLKIVVYVDFPHFISSFFGLSSALDALYAGPHSVVPVFKAIPSTPDTRAAEMAQLFDTSDGHRPDAIYLAISPGSFIEALSDYSTTAIAYPRPPASADNQERRNFLLPALLAAGGGSLEGSSVQLINSSSSGGLFKTAFVSATGQQPELTSSFLYDAVVAQAGAIGVARSNSPTVFPELVRDSFPDINVAGGTIIRPRVSDFKTAATRIKNHQAINYDGASSPLDLTADTGENYPDLVHWRIQSGAFLELERYQCDPDHPNCARRP
jgi:hypothetical protein